MIEKKIWTLLPGADPVPSDTETQRDYAVRAFGFQGVRGRLPKEITEAFVASTGEVRNQSKADNSNGIRGAKAQEGEVVRAPGMNGGKAARWKKGSLVDLPDAEVLALVQGRKISWSNEVCEGLGVPQLEEAKIGGLASIIVTKRGRRCLQFVPYEGQEAMSAMRVVGLDRL